MKPINSPFFSKPPLATFAITAVAAASLAFSGFAAGDSAIPNRPPSDDASMVDVSHGLGIPFGGVGTGYSVFGKYGFVWLNVNGRPVNGPYHAMDPANYYTSPATRQAPFCFVLEDGPASTVLQQTAVPWLPAAKPLDAVTCRAYLPKGFFTFNRAGLDLRLAMTGFSPMIPHDVAGSSVPVQVFDFQVDNPGGNERTITLRLAHEQALTVANDVALLREAKGEMAFAAVGGTADTHGAAVTMRLAPGKRQTARFLVAWYYPGLNVTKDHNHKRLYTTTFGDATAVIARARDAADGWSQAIDAWHDAFDVPPAFKRLWFSSLSSVITSSMLTADHLFYEEETPHYYVNTMDVTAYSNWLYLINWPELERMDMNQFFSCIPTEGEKKGFVWHSLWADAAHYVEEPTFLVRLWRDYCWFNDRQWLAKGFPHAVNAANRAYIEDAYEFLISSKQGNQSYDRWKMPGVSSYVNSAWVYGVYGLERMAEELGQPATIGGKPAAEIRQAAATSFDRLLWNKATGCWNCFSPAPGAPPRNIPESVFSDQLFGKWMLLLDSRACEILPANKVKQALTTIYHHNLLDDPKRGFRGWTNGRKPDGSMDPSGAHAKTCWIGAQTDLASLLGDSGEEEASLDVFRSLESSLHNNHLAVGEWNQAIGKDGLSQTLPDEPGKDTPRFPSYPRYKCAWEYLIRMLGLKMDSKEFQMTPFSTLGFRLTGVKLAGTTWTVSVTPKWTRALVDGKEVKLPVRIDRSRQKVTVSFVP